MKNLLTQNVIEWNRYESIQLDQLFKIQKSDYSTMKFKYYSEYSPMSFIKNLIVSCSHDRH